ncbi:MAG TPA: FAD-linked oxidase C-terminal domain-containing protein, partial [Candidatus Dormibacteraeota bacterium]|nr:FAD-linked oxidase C-terminal domain-containing protein [Candidatus Dormibacteraeota bacterium]
LGTLGVVTRAVFRLHPLPHHARSFTIAAANPEETQKLVLTIQDSKLGHVALQAHFSAESTPTIDILFEGTEAGLDTQATQLRSLCRSAQIAEASPAVWDARQTLWSLSNAAETTIAKISFLPIDLARTIELFRRATDPHRLPWNALIYATGLGWLHLKDAPENTHLALASLRSDLEKMSGSLLLLHRPANLQTLDAWGTPGDSLPLMKAIKHQLDPANTLNPGRFLGGI